MTSDGNKTIFADGIICCHSECKQSWKHSHSLWESMIGNNHCETTNFLGPWYSLSVVGVCESVREACHPIKSIFLVDKHATFISALCSGMESDLWVIDFFFSMVAAVGYLSNWRVCVYSMAIRLIGMMEARCQMPVTALVVTDTKLWRKKTGPKSFVLLISCGVAAVLESIVLASVLYYVEYD